MTSTKIASISAWPGEQPHVPVNRLSMRLAWMAVLVLGTGILDGQVTGVHAERTSMQAIITYTAPDNGVCSVEVHEGDLTGPLVPDVDPSVFPGSNLDNRAVNINLGRKRVFVAGKRVAETAIDGLRHSRALQAFTGHSFKITCGSSTATGVFTTMNPPVGASHSDSLPADPLKPGQYGWPDVSWSNRNQWVVDPLTGFRVKQFDSPRDGIEFVGSGIFASASNVAGGSDWNTPAAAVSNTDNSAAATYSATTQGFLFVELGVGFGTVAQHLYTNGSPNALVPTFNAYCSSADCASASSDDRSIQFCLTVNGVSCASDFVEAALTPCTTNCGGLTITPFPNPQPILADWYASRHGIPNIDITDLSKHTGYANRNGASVSWVYGDRFDLNWTAGSTITINGTSYVIASVNNDSSITLSGSPAGSDVNAPFAGSNAGLLIRKKTASTNQISIQYISYSYEFGDGATLDSAGDGDNTANCSPVLVPGPGGELGFHCNVSAIYYWIGDVSGTVNRIGRSLSNYNPAPDGWNNQACFPGAYWDWNDGNSVYCPTNDYLGHLRLFKFTYNGGNTDIGDLGDAQMLVLCNGSNTPCWTFTNLTPGNQALDLQMAAFSPDWAAAHFKTNFIFLFGRMGTTNSLLFMARRDQNNDTMSFLFRYDLNTGKIVGGTPTWAHYPLRWGVMHGPGNSNDPSYVQVSATYFRGPFTGVDYTAGNGPYYSVITTPGGADATGQPCPARPGNSPIPAAEWPTGNRCISLTVDGQPGDPTPAQYSAGTVSVNGNALTGTGTYFTANFDQTQIQIAGNFYNFTFVDYAHGTLDQTLTTPITNSPYTIYQEPIGNPKVGNPAFAYLQDVQVRDIFCVTQQTGCQFFNYAANEFLRLIYIDPSNSKSWILQRGYAGAGQPPQTSLPIPAGGFLVAMATGCQFNSLYPCADSRILWNALADPYALNASGTTLVNDSGDKGCCHSTRQNSVNVDVGLFCPDRGGQGGETGCAFARFSGLPAAFTDPGYTISINPLFHNMVGIGAPNAVDIHPSHNQAPTASTPNEFRWIGDARPFLGDAVLDPGTLISGTLYKFTAAQVHTLHPKVFPTIASCGANPLLDVSGTSITGASQDNYKYCVALHGGDCIGGSAAGDLYVNCPQIRTPSCLFQGVGASDPDTRDICVGDMGGLTMNLTQNGIDRPDPDGNNSRRVSTAFSHYKWVNPFWNVKILPDGRWMLGWSSFFQGQRNSVLLIKLPPFPTLDGINRGDYIAQSIHVPAPRVPGATVTNAVVQFGYDTNYFCTTRRETCLQGAAADFAYQSENPAGVACTTGCVIPVPAISQRVLYYQVLLRDASNHVVGQMTPEAVIIP